MARKPRRRWLQFSLRMFLLGVAAVAVVLGLIVGDSQRQRQIVTAIRQRGGHAYGRIVYSPWRPRRLYQLLGKEFAPQEKWSVDLYIDPQGPGAEDERGPVGDETLALAAQLRKVRDLNACRTMITDEGMRHLRGVSGLECLNLCSNDLGDAGVEHLRGMTALRELRLCDTCITDKALETIGTLTALEYLYLSGTRVTDAGLWHLGGLAHLHILSLRQTAVSDAGLEHLRDLANLEEIDLAETRATDEGLRHLGGLPKLGSVDLGNTSIGDGAIKHLTGLPARVLRLGGTQITGRGFQGRVLRGKGRTIIFLDGCPVDDEGLRWIAQFRGVAAVSLMETRITDKGVEWLLQAEDGCDVGLYGTSISDEGLKVLHGRKGKLSICAGATEVTKAGAAELMRACPECTVCLDCGLCRTAVERRAAALGRERTEGSEVFIK